MRCNNCGSFINDNDGFCGNCGAKVQPQFNQANYQNQGKNSNTAVIVLTVIITLLLVVVIGLFTAIKLGVFGKDNTEVTNTVTYVTEEPSERIRVNGTASDEYIYESDRYYITEDQLSMLSRDEVRLILNEMYARHGYIFQTDTYIRYFMGKSWYNPRISSNAEVEALFNAIEKENLETIVNYETKMGWR